MTLPQRWASVVRSILPALFVLVVIEPLSGCGEPGGDPSPELAPPPPAPASPMPAVRAGPWVVDLTERLPVDPRPPETLRIDFGTPEARRHLVAGWSDDEGTPEIGFYVWGTGPESTLRIHIHEPRALRVRFRAVPVDFPDVSLATPVVYVSVPGLEVAELTLAADRPVRSFELPARALLPGWNELTFAYGRRAVPADIVPGSEDVRSLGAIWDWLEIESDDPAPIVDHAAGRITLRPGAFVEVATRLPVGSMLHADRVASSAPPDVALRVVVTPQSGQPAAMQPTGSSLEAGIPLHEAGADVAIARLRIESPLDVGATIDIEGLRLEASSPAAMAIIRPLPNVVLYVADSVRPDHLSAYGYARATSPSLEVLAAGGQRFADARAVSSWTRPNVATLLTGLAPRDHGVGDTVEALPASVVTLPEYMQGLGARTVAVSESPDVTPALGFDQGFDEFHDLTAPHESARALHGASIAHPMSDDLHEHAIHWIESHGAEAPFLLYVHATTPSAPYRAAYHELVAVDAPESIEPGIGELDAIEAMQAGTREMTASRLDGLRGLYDGQLRRSDRFLGELLAALKREGLARATIFVYVSDHGEAFGEQQLLGHGNGLYDELLRVPLVIRFDARSGLEAGVARVPYAHEDLLPTLVSGLGIDPVEGVRGVDWRAVLRGEAPAPIDRIRRAHHRRSGEFADAVVEGDWKLIERSSEPGAAASRELFHLAEDPLEQRDLAAEEPERVAALVRAISAPDAAVPPIASPVPARDEPDLVGAAP